MLSMTVTVASSMLLFGSEYYIFCHEAGGTKYSPGFTPQETILAGSDNKHCFACCYYLKGAQFLCYAYFEISKL